MPLLFIMFHLSFFQIYFCSYLAYLISDIKLRHLLYISLGWGDPQGSPACLSTSRWIPTSAPLPKTFIVSISPKPCHPTLLRCLLGRLLGHPCLFITIQLSTLIHPLPPSCRLYSLSPPIVSTCLTLIQMSVTVCITSAMWIWTACNMILNNSHAQICYLRVQIKINKNQNTLLKKKFWNFWWFLIIRYCKCWLCAKTCYWSSWSTFIFIEWRRLWATSQTV